MSLVLACDLGGTSLRAGLLDEQGRVRATCALPAPPDLDSPPGRSEIDPDAWWRLFAKAVDVLGGQAGPLLDEVHAVAVCGVTRTQILVAPDGRALRPAITWRDARAAETLAGLTARLPANHPETPLVNAFHPLARLDWLARHEPALLDVPFQVLEPKDWINLRLTGEAASDPVSSARLEACARPGPSGSSLLDVLGLPASIVPPLLPPTAIMGRVRPRLPGALARFGGRPVLALANDTWASVIGLGAMREGFGYNLSGTTEVFGILSGNAAAAEGLMSVDWGAGLRHLGGPSQNGADTLVWVLQLLSRHQGDASAAVGPALEALLAEPRDPQPLLFLPFLQGERTPYWDPALRGALVGLNRRHRAGDLAFAVLEGVACLNRVVLERAEAALGRPVREIRFGGGGAANAPWCQIKADMLERPLAVTGAEEPGLLGCAIAARLALGEAASLANGQAALVRVARRFEPRPERREACRALFRLFEQSAAALRPISHALAAWPASDE